MNPRQATSHRENTIRGFTLIELLITVTIVAVLASIALPMSEVVVQRNKEQELRSALRQIREAIDAYKKASDAGQIEKTADQTGYPRTLDDLVQGAEGRLDPKRRTIYFLRRIPRDPFAADDIADPARTWGKRSYASRPESPHEGSDVFDVYTLSNGVGLNGIPYKEW